MYITPALVLYAAFFLWPFIQLVLLGFQKWDGLKPKQWVGFDNYVKLIEDPSFWKAFQHNIGWMMAAMILPVFIGLMLAILLYRSPLHGKTIFRGIYFMPQVISSVVVAVIWRWIYNPNFGALNALLESVGLASLKRGWLGEPDLVLPALFIASTWINYGFTMVIFVAALQGIDEVYFDAAKVDGANWLQQFRHILIPFIQGPLTTVVLIMAIAAFQVFDLVFIITRGGPGTASMVLSVYLYKNAFSFHKVGYGSAVAVVLGVIILLFSIVFLRLRGVLGERK